MFTTFLNFEENFLWKKNGRIWTDPDPHTAQLVQLQNTNANMTGSFFA